LLLILHQSLIEVFKITPNHLYLKKEFHIKILIYVIIDVFYFNQFLHNLSNKVFKNIILIRFKEIEANYLYIYQKNSFKKLVT
jgi:hypothetical protein